MDVQFAKGLSGAKVNVQLMYVLIYHRPSPTEGDAFTGLCDIGLLRFAETPLVSKLGIKVKFALGRRGGTCPPLSDQYLFSHPPHYHRGSGPEPSPLPVERNNGGFLCRCRLVPPVHLKLRRDSARHLPWVGHAELQIPDCFLTFPSHLYSVTSTSLSIGIVMNQLDSFEPLCICLTLP